MIDGTLFNVLMVIIGSLVGLALRAQMPEKMIELIFQALGLFTLFLGIQMGLKTEGNLVVIVFSLVFGAMIGYGLSLENRCEQLSEWFKNKVKSDNNRFTEGLLTAFILFCVGPLSMMGSIQDGLGEPADLLFTKSIMDGFSSAVLAAGFGVGVLFSVIPMLVFQGSISMVAGQIAPWLSDSMLNEWTAVGGILLLGLSLNILSLKKISVLNLLPALLIAPILFYLWSIWGISL